MVERTVEYAASAMAGQVIAGDPSTVWRGAALDSRQVRGGELFFALAGERTDGHRFVGAAVAAGAAGAVVERSPSTGRGALIRVADGLAGLHDLTRAVRRETPDRLVAITGSVGKTTTKEMLAALLATRFRVAKSPGNLNNLYGFPIALLGAPDATEWMVAEMGMSTPGELARVSRLGRPDAALLLNVRPAHLGSFPDLRGIAEAKAELLEGLAPEGVAVVNGDDPLILEIARRHEGRVVRFGTAAASDVRLDGLEPLGGDAVGSRFRLSAVGESQEIVLPLHGPYNAENFLAAAACAWALGVTLGVAAEVAAGLEPPPMRGVVHRLPGGTTLVDDCYNANPYAVERALEGAAALPGRMRVAVLGSMLELGPEAARYHREVGARAAELGFSQVVGVGDLARELVAAAGEAGARTAWFRDAATAARQLAEGLPAGSVVLVKGSRGIGMEAIVEALLGAPKGSP